MGLTRAMAKEGAEDRIRVAAICPSLVSKPDGRFSGPKLIAIEDVTSTLDYLLHLSSAAWPTEIVLERRKS
tara:strand:- start:2043 stop:2255 length:213 start_codon:yes stop_codon:yes gene_type:complete